MKKIYLDYAASTPVDPLVLREMLPYFGKKYGNPGSLHAFGQEGMAAIDRARETVAQSIGAEFREIIFTGSATEANNLALRGAVKFFHNHQAIVFQNQNNFSPAEKFSFPSARHFRFTKNQAGAPAGYSSKQSAFGRKNLPIRIIISSIEHESILETAKDLEKEGVEIVIIPIDKNGIVDLKKLKSALNERTILVSVMYANNEIGTIQPITEIAKIIETFRIQRSSFSNKKNLNPLPSTLYPLFHSDAVQAFQYLNCDVQKLGVDLMTLSVHKIYGPKGVGALYIGRRVQGEGYDHTKNFNPQPSTLNPIVTGGGQEFGMRSGTENVPAIVGFAKAAELAVKNREKVFKHVSELRNYFWKELKKIYPQIVVNGGTLQHYSPHILNVYFPNQKSQDLLIKLDMAGIAVSSGAACSTRTSKLSHVLKALCLPPARIQSSLRFSFGKYTTKTELLEALKRIEKILLH